MSKKVILIMTDTQRWDMCGCYKNTGLSTPCIDKLAQNGMRFERAYTTQPVCQPARAGIFLGQYPHSCGSWANSMGISDNSYSIGKRLSDKGIHTAYIGKWHLDGGDYFGLGKCPEGWDSKYWYDMRLYLEELTEEERIESRTPETMRKRAVPAEFTFGRRCSNRAVDFLQNHGNEDFFLAVSFDEPHDPYLCPSEYASMYEDYEFPITPSVYDTLENKPDFQRVWSGGTHNADKSNLKIKHPFYFGCNSFIDSEIGRIIDIANKYAPDAFVIYTSDHGDFLGSHSLSGKGPAAYDEITRIPLVISGPGIKKGSVTPHPVSHINIAPMVMEIMGFQIPQTLHGASILPQLKNPQVRVNDHVFIGFGRYETDHDKFGGLQLMRSVFDGRYKLTVNLLSSDELYDLETDPYEMENLINNPGLAQIRDRLHDVLLKHQNDSRDPFRGYYWERRPWRTDAPEPVWYAGGMTRQRIEDEAYEKRQLDYIDGLPITEAVRKK